MADHHDLPFKAEYAKSGRASCKGCSGSIAKDSLRLAIMIQSPMFDGKIPNWYHFACFWKRARVAAFTDVHGFESLRWDDQQKIKDKVASGGGAGGDSGSSGGAGGDFNVEYAKSNRSTCRGCDSKIDKDELRVSKKEYESQRAKMYGPQDLWHHVECFKDKREDLGFGPEKDPSEIKGYARLTKEDKEMLVQTLGKGDKKLVVKRKASEKSEQALKKQKTETEEEKALREQSQILWKIRDALQRDVSNQALKCLLEYNAQGLPAGESKLLDRVSDCMAFGALEPCAECSGQFAYSQGGYRCTGNVTEWTKCLNKTTKPKKKKVPTATLR